MNPHIEIESTRSLAGALGERFWGWEIPTYLFAGGVVAGIMVVVSAIRLAGGRERVSEAMRVGLSLAPVLLALGMAVLFLDLTAKAHVFRFYAAFRPSSPMSWGSWILIAVVPIEVGLTLALPPKWLAVRLERSRLAKWCAERDHGIAVLGLVLGAALGVYTGILLSSLVARPLWSSGALGALFLASGASTGIALIMLLERDRVNYDRLARLDVIAIGVELGLLALWLIGLWTQGPLGHAAAALVLGGSHAPVFLGLVLFGGLVLPALLEISALMGKAASARAVPALVLVGGFLLRVVVVYAGQAAGFVQA